MSKKWNVTLLTMALVSTVWQIYNAIYLLVETRTGISFGISFIDRFREPYNTYLVHLSYGLLSLALAFSLFSILNRKPLKVAPVFYGVAGLSTLLLILGSIPTYRLMKTAMGNMPFENSKENARFLLSSANWVFQQIVYIALLLFIVYQIGQIKQLKWPALFAVLISFGGHVILFTWNMLVIGSSRLELSILAAVAQALRILLLVIPIAGLLLSDRRPENTNSETPVWQPN